MKKPDPKKPEARADFFSQEELREQLHSVRQLDTNYDQARVKALDRPGVGYEEIVNNTARMLVQDYRTLVWMLLSTETLNLLSRDLASMRGRKAGKVGKPSRRNPKLEAWVLKNAKARTAGEVRTQLELMEPAKLRKSIGQATPPSLATVKRILNGQ